LNIEDVRFLLTALIQALPTVASLCVIALFAFPKFYIMQGREKSFKSRKKTFRFFLFIFGILILVTFLTVYFLSADLLDLSTLIEKNTDVIYNHVTFAVVVLFITPVSLVIYMFKVSSYKLEDINV